MIKVGITGGIGSGKSLVCQIFNCLGIPVYDADSRAKKLMTGDKHVKNAIIHLLGKEAYFKNGKLNRSFIAQNVFSNAERLKSLNGIVHPAVAADGEAWFRIQEKEGKPYAIKEAALLIESQSFKTLDKLIVVTAPTELRIARVIERDQSTRDQVIARISKQMRDEDRLPFADFIINNDENNSLIFQVLQIHQQLIRDRK